MLALPEDKITPFLWFDQNAEEAANFYVSLFADAKIVDVARWGPGAPYPEGSTMSASFELFGRPYIAFNGGPYFKPSEAFSLFVSCRDQAEVDCYWAALTADGGEPSECGWLKDRFGISWQIVPTALIRLLGDADPGRAGCAMQAMRQMGKIDIAALERAVAGAP
jgi:predicted 3-demethylubiquinone-9 3-methyltransferase (glyoxalase superfamily)